MSTMNCASSRITPEEHDFAKSLKLPTALDPRVANTPFGEAHRNILNTALRIKNEYYNKGYYCFLHANEPGRAVLSWFRKKLIKASTPERDIRLFQFLRDPATIYKKKTISAIGDDTNDQQGDDRTDLLSVDSFFFNFSYRESANSFCDEKRSLLQLIHTPDLSSLFNSLPNAIDRVPFQNRLIKIIDTFADSSPCGNLYVFCIPKNQFKETVYRSHPKGKPCRCVQENFRTLNDAEAERILNEFQQDKTVNTLSDNECLQYRILAHCLTPENGVRGFLLAPNQVAKKAAKREIKQLIKDLMLSVSEAYALKLPILSPQAPPQAQTTQTASTPLQEPTAPTATWTHLKAAMILGASYLLFNRLLR